MMIRNMKTMLMGLCTLIICATLQANETTPAGVEEMRIEKIDESFIPQDSMEQAGEVATCAAICNVIRPAGEDDFKIEEERIGLIPEELLQQMENVSFARQMYYDDSYYLSRIHPYAFYSVSALKGPGDYAKLQDGTVWHVHPYYRSIIKSWAQDQVIFIKPDAACFSSYRYVLYNRATNEIVKVNYIEAQDPFYMSTVYLVSGVDSIRNIVYLNDGTTFYMNPKNGSFKKWWIGDRIIVGVNNKWRETSYPHILINASIEKAPYCEAKIN